jgi:hypothetical protein
LALSVIILAGASNSGKSATLGVLKKRLHHERGRNFYSLKGRWIGIFPSSPQEISRIDFCDYQEVIKYIKDKIRRCEARNCALLIMPFVMKGERNGKSLNKYCIEKPIASLKSQGYKVHLAYLRKDSLRKKQLDLMDDLMSRLKAQEIKSRRGDQKRQAAELWKIARTLDP